VALTELFFALVLTYQDRPQEKDYVRVDFATADACLDAVANLITAEEEYPILHENTIKHAVCVDRHNGKPLLEYRLSLETP